MRADEHREVPSEGLATRLEEVREEYFNLRFQNATGQLENFGQLKKAKRDIARILTIMRERELGIEVEIREPQPKKKWRRTKPAEDVDEAEHDEQAEDDRAAMADTPGEPEAETAHSADSEEEGKPNAR